MMETFDTIIDRSDTVSEKYEALQQIFGTTDLFPMWIADMDIACPDFIRKAIIKRANHPIYGYTLVPDAFYEAVKFWQARRYSYSVDRAWITPTNCVINAMNIAIQAFSEKNEAIMIQPPVYQPFFSAISNNQRHLIEAPLTLQDNYYEFNFATIESLIKQHKVKLFILCNPHNPGGRVWRKQELEQLAEICLRHNVIIISDEIHSDIVYEPYQHIPIASLSEAVNQITITLNSPNKIFNIAGLQMGYAIIANARLKKRFEYIIDTLHLAPPNIFSMVAMLAAYTEQGITWINQLLPYLKENIVTTTKILNLKMPHLKIMQPEATYLMWVDFSYYFESQQALYQWILYQVKLAPSGGTYFGNQGIGFLRFNIALPRPQLIDALDNIHFSS